MNAATPEDPAPNPANPGSGLMRDVRQIRQHGKASAAELREFFAQTRGRSPQEVLGMLTGSHLTRSIALATVGITLLLVAASVVPWLWGRGDKSQSAAAPQTTEPAGNQQDRPESPAPETNSVAGDSPSVDPQPSPEDARKAASAMGLGDTKVADPETNPLEKKLDSLLDNVK